ncbi:Polyketide cyclase / dehydrase and lipid transport [Flavobacterium micromati]|uniref:Polyketide cyclase / dehydrase and lipid transport n=1 Tax=Flavobacterium micromati TaxID=229205 RepID=A0A1M5QJE3_9FLAO|nr:SRPBCC family protein [Flavobacterium micromati]SHH13971.1 Polyketide cyclase / dehydrase and lipid transport [Flavobacterium micromati]
MRILKYLFLLLLLSFVASTIFIATQKGNFTVERSQIINSPKSNVFNYVNDLKNFVNYSSWIRDDSSSALIYSDKTFGVGAKLSWEGTRGSGDVKTNIVKANDSISQEMNFDGNSSSVFWTFKDTTGGTKVTWKSVGKMNFKMKVYTAFNGGIDRMVGIMLERSLINLNKVLDLEINSFTVKVDGLAIKPGSFYLKQTFTSKIENVTKNSRIVFQKIITFCDKNNIELNGKPFILYHTYNLTTGLTTLSFCIPIKNQIMTSSGSDILAGKLEQFDAIKTTLKGDYMHSQKAIDKTIAYINSNKIELDQSFSHLEILKTSRTENSNPSQWVSELYFPIKPKVIPVRTYFPAARKKIEEIIAPIPAPIKEEEESEF